MNRYALSWCDTALKLEAENKQIRELMSALLMAILHNRELYDMARGELRERFPEEPES